MAARKSQKAGVLENLIQKEVARAVKDTIKDQNLATSKEVKSLTGELKQVRKQLGRVSAGKTKTKTDGRKRAGRKPTYTTCTVRGCNKPHYAKGLCASHYQKERREATAGTGAKGKKKKAGRKPGRKKTAKK